jgi:hypothetical protein
VRTETDFECAVPDGNSGDWAVQSFEVSEEAAKLENLRHSLRGASWAMIRPGVYKRLLCPGGVMMSNTPMELRTNQWIIAKAKGRVLINGLGLGCVLTAILKKPEVTEVWVVEREKDVIDLVWPTFASDPRCKLIHADALEYRPPKGVRFDVVWHDIWLTICADNLNDMKRLHRRYGRISDKQASWCREIIEAELGR